MDLVDLLLRIGSPSVTIIVLWLAGRACARAGSWLKSEVILPLVNSHRAWVQAQIDTAQTNTKLLARQTELIAAIDEKINGLACRNGEPHPRNGDNPGRESRPGIPR